MLNFITGAANSGKSTWCKKWAEEQIAGGRDVNGWITPPHIEGDKKTGHDFYRIIHSKFIEPVPFSRLTPFEGAVRVGPYFIHKNIFEELAVPIDGLLIIDEIGALEMERRQGFYPCLAEIFRRAEDSLVVVQERVLGRFLAEFAGYNPQKFQP